MREKYQRLQDAAREVEREIAELEQKHCVSSAVGQRFCRENASDPTFSTKNRHLLVRFRSWLRSVGESDSSGRIRATQWPLVRQVQ